MASQLRNIEVHISVLKQVFYNTLAEALRKRGLGGIVHINGDILIKRGKILNLRFDGIDGVEGAGSRQ